jgi:tRNA(Arg) A34 adenosine deaminase TadA
MTDAPFDAAPILAHCVELAAAAAAAGNSPIAAGAVTLNGAPVAWAANNQWVSGDVTAHAERLLLTALAGAGVDPAGLWVVSNAEPCSMCASALVKARVAGVVFGAPAEPSMDPWLPIGVVVAASAHPLVVVGPVNAAWHAEQVAQGRRAAAQMRLVARPTAG